MLGESFGVQQVANAFVHQYYAILHDRPHDVHKFYNESSLLGWTGDEFTVTSVTTLKGIDEKIMSLEPKDWGVQIKTVDAQESMEGGVIVAVNGCFIVDENTKKNFSQTFFLAKQETGFFVLNDILRFSDVESHAHVMNHETANIQADPTHDSEPSQVDNPVQEETVVNEGNVNPSVVDNATAEVEVSKPSSTPSKKNVDPIVETPTKVEENVKKVTYASMVLKTSPTSSPTASPVNKTVQVSTTAKQLVVSPVPKSPTKEEALKTSTISSNVASKVSTPSYGGPNANAHGEARGIYIGNLPYSITKHSLVEAIKQFGQVKRVNDSVQIRKHEDGFCCGFVEFESPDSARHAVEAHHVMFGDKEAYITYKRSNRGAAQPVARGGFHNGNFRRRENAEGFNNWRFQNEDKDGFRRPGSGSRSSRSIEAEYRPRSGNDGGERVAAAKGG